MHNARQEPPLSSQFSQGLAPLVYGQAWSGNVYQPPPQAGNVPFQGDQYILPREQPRVGWRSGRHTYQNSAHGHLTSTPARPAHVQFYATPSNKRAHWESRLVRPQAVPWSGSHTMSPASGAPATTAAASAKATGQEGPKQQRLSPSSEPWRPQEYIEEPAETEKPAQPDLGKRKESEATAAGSMIGASLLGLDYDSDGDSEAPPAPIEGHQTAPLAPVAVAATPLGKGECGPASRGEQPEKHVVDSVNLHTEPRAPPERSPLEERTGIIPDSQEEEQMQEQVNEELPAVPRPGRTQQPTLALQNGGTSGKQVRAIEAEERLRGEGDQVEAQPRSAKQAKTAKKPHEEAGVRDYRAKQPTAGRNRGRGRHRKCEDPESSEWLPRKELDSEDSRSARSPSPAVEGVWQGGRARGVGRGAGRGTGRGRRGRGARGTMSASPPPGRGKRRASSVLSGPEETPRAKRHQPARKAAPKKRLTESPEPLRTSSRRATQPTRYAELELDISFGTPEDDRATMPAKSAGKVTQRPQPSRVSPDAAEAHSPDPPSAEPGIDQPQNKELRADAEQQPRARKMRPQGSKGARAASKGRAQLGRKRKAKEVDEVNSKETTAEVLESGKGSPAADSRVLQLTRGKARATKKKPASVSIRGTQKASADSLEAAKEAPAQPMAKRPQSRSTELHVGTATGLEGPEVEQAAQKDLVDEAAGDDGNEQENTGAAAPPPPLSPQPKSPSPVVAQELRPVGPIQEPLQQAGTEAPSAAPEQAADERHSPAAADVEAATAAAAEQPANELPLLLPADTDAAAEQPGHTSTLEQPAVELMPPPANDLVTGGGDSSLAGCTSPAAFDTRVAVDQGNTAAGQPKATAMATLVAPGALEATPLRRPRLWESPQDFVDLVLQGTDLESLFPEDWEWDDRIKEVIRGEVAKLLLEKREADVSARELEQHQVAAANQAREQEQRHAEELQVLQDSIDLLNLEKRSLDSEIQALEAQSLRNEETLSNMKAELEANKSRAWNDMMSQMAKIGLIAISMPTEEDEDQQ